ncbi:MAG: sugar system component [Frankiaceae bacterium]|jgi:PTS system N-acetylglucosamine-specific IIA component|nr:sugar system component [Frankiaceae bacterium]MDQ1727457.1 sugar system component [Frankiaceae bacterium]
MSLAVLAPVTGTVIGLPQVPDPVFAEAMVGPGTAIDPERVRAEALSPIAGRLVKLHPHAFVVVDDSTGVDRGVLVHLGIDTVQLEGAGFELLAAEGDVVTAGQPVVRWNPADVEAGGRSPVCPVVALGADASDLTDVLSAGSIKSGDPLMTWR